MGSTNISEITEIRNETKDTYYMYVWDNAHEGRYRPFDDSSDWQYPSEGRWQQIAPGARLRADDCGIPDGGKAGGKDRTRVIFKAKPNGKPKGQGDPNYGLRVNRVGRGNGHDALVFRDNSNSRQVFDMELPTNMHQSLLVTISDKDGIEFHQTDIARSEQDQAEEGLKEFGKSLKTLLEMAKNLSEIAAGA